ncbi:MAG: metallophosphoesterase [Chitinophagaceae bacterium]
MYKTNTILAATLFASSFLWQAKKETHPSTPPVISAVIDGPYIFYGNDSVFIKYIEDNGGIKSVRTESMPGASRGDAKVLVYTGEAGKTFSVSLKSKLSNEKTEYNNVKKMLVISDIEGNFAAFRNLLQVNGVIDENFNWTFNKDHLVLTGDFVDRGMMVMEVLWLIYSLEEKAKAAGGYVHFILGNHEIMNMSGDLRYVQARYPEHAALMNTQYTKLFGPDTEIGRWLSTKNVVERVGNTLFSHGGISPYVNNMQISLNELNNVARPHYRDSAAAYTDPRVDILYSDVGPFWYRGYYTGSSRATMQQVDSTLQFYGVRYIGTGHTIIANNISSNFDGKVFDTDVHHADGHSEALLVEGNKFFRVNAAGEKFPVAAWKGQSQ